MTEMWHFIADNKLRDGSTPASVGGVERWDGPVVLCESGLHACPRPLDALLYAPAGKTIQARLVSLSGIVVTGDDKAAASLRRIIASADCTRELHEFALWCAELVHHLITDERSLAALDAKRCWLDGQATAAWDAARAAARNAALAAAGASAGDAAWAAARNAALDAARNAALAAAWASAGASAGASALAAAWVAARDAAWDVQNVELERRLREKLGAERGEGDHPA